MMTPETPLQTEETFAETERLESTSERMPAAPGPLESAPADAVFARAVLTSPLHLEVAAESRTNRWTEWNGYTVPQVLSNADEEYRALRGAAVMMDISPLRKYRIAGRDALRYLDRLVAGGMKPLGMDRARHVIFCESAGMVLGDGLLFCVGEDEYRLVIEEAHLAWLMDSAEGFRMRVEDVSTALAGLAVQGPLSAVALTQAGAAGIEALAPGEAANMSLAGIPVYVSRTGATGDLGYELWCDAEDAPHLWRVLLDAAAPSGLRPAGFALRELARLEAGHPRAGHDYLSAFAAIDGRDALPPAAIWPELEISSVRSLFNGGAALRAIRNVPPSRRIVRLAVEGFEPMCFSAVLSDGKIVGAATSTGFSPALGANIALAIVDGEAVAAGGLSVVAERWEGLSVVELPASVRVLAAPAFSHPRRVQHPAPLQP